MAGELEFEEALGAVESKADRVVKSAAGVARELKKAKSAATTGQVRDLRRSLEQAETLASDLASQAAALRRSYDFDEAAHLSSGGYARELLAAAESAQLRIFEEDERLLCYPSLVRILPGEAAIEVDRKRDRRLRPSAVVRQLQAAQSRGPRFKAEPFLEAVQGAYDAVVAKDAKRSGAIVRLVELWGLLTLLPGQNREYTKQEFARDLYLLDQSATHIAKDGRAIGFHASTGTKGSGVLTTVARDGQLQRYWGVSFA